jgi:hypothetical protein
MRNNAFVNFLVIGWASFCAIGCDTAKIPNDVQTAMEQLPEHLDYNIHVKPILSDRCFACHGPDKNKQKANLRLDVPEGYDKECESGRKAIVKGNLTKSDVFHRITSSDPDMVMPTPGSHLTLSTQEKAILLQWIKEGAEWQEHWSLSKIENPEVPKVKNEAWAINDIDRFVLKKLEEKGLKPGLPADKATLLRRVSLDLTGLPPTPEEQTAYINDKDKNAYEKVINRLITSPHFGEHLASNWLDVARYADTRGYQSDPFQNVFPYRDWVIEAFNRNLRYDKFIQWQLAGDLLPNPTRRQLLATCFLRLHPQNIEVGIIPEEYRTEYVIDRVNTFGKAFLAHSVECARCHDHKYDPISQKDFYRLYAFFNNNREIGEVAHAGEPSPSMVLMSRSAEDSLKSIRQWIAKLSKNTASYPDLPVRTVANENTVEKALNSALLTRHGFDDTTGGKVKNIGAKGIFKNSGNSPVTFIPGKVEKALRLENEQSVNYTEKLLFDRFEPFSISIWLNLLDRAANGIVLGTVMNGMIDGYRGYCVQLNPDRTLSVIFAHSYPANGIEMKSREKITPGQWKHLVLTYDGSSSAKGISVYADGQRLGFTVLNDQLERSLLYTFGENYLLKTQQAFRIGSRIQASIKGVAVDEFSAYNRVLSRAEIQYLGGDKQAVQQMIAAVSPTPQQRELRAEWYRLTSDRAYAETQAALRSLRESENRILSTQLEVMIYRETQSPRASFVLNRGAYEAPGEKVSADVPHKLPPLAKGLPRNRLGLAQWLLSDEHPLFARVTVNRYWQMMFGRGLVNSSDDFGNQGALPTHPELLDWLSFRFRQHWNTKALLKEMVMSATYRQSSVPSRASLEKDPDNLLLSRYPTYRMSAEIVRDNVLAGAGLLNRTVGGKSVKIYQPDGIWEALGNGNVINSRYVQDHGKDLYRRSMYTFWKRNAPHPAMVNFDSPDRFSCVIKRQKTSTPLQSLVTLNDPQFFEAARVLAQRGMEKGLKNDAMVDFIFQSLISRRARSDEKTIMAEMYKNALGRYSDKPAKARQVLSVGEYPVPMGLPAAETAAWALVASTVMNFDEAIVKR